MSDTQPRGVRGTPRNIAAEIEDAKRRHPAGKALPERSQLVTVRLKDSEVEVLKRHILEAGWCSDYTPSTLLWQFLRMQDVIA